ncbi:MAG TPA: hypothetical protein VGK93_01475 [Candidatus Eisenbacteria bacterium]|jgi:hypothetical protein
MMGRAFFIFLLLTAAPPRPSWSGADPHQAHRAMADSASHPGMAGTDRDHAEHVEHAAHLEHPPGANPNHLHLPGMYGPYSVTREASGTAWQPEAAKHRGVHVMRGGWSFMLHGMVDLVYDRQGGPRGDEKVYSANMVMGLAQRPLGSGRLGLRVMASLEPATIGRNGYPLLLQTGETADGRRPLIDRQHPHDLFMELAGSYRIATGDRSCYLYAGLPGEPALGPPAFMHRFSGMSFPQAPITHHWLDSTHISYGVVTLGAVQDGVKVEASTFHGREPDQDRWNIESPKLDSPSFRLSVNPTPSWALQMSYGRLESPEQLEPEVDQDRTTASAIYEGRLRGGHWQGMLAWGRNRNRPGRRLDAFDAEATVELSDAHTLLARLERVEKDELFPEAEPRAGQPFVVGEASAGYRYDFWHDVHAVGGIGVLGTVTLVPARLRDTYGKHPESVFLFGHLGLR